MSINLSKFSLSNNYANSILSTAYSWRTFHKCMCLCQEKMIYVVDMSFVFLFLRYFSTAVTSSVTSFSFGVFVGDEVFKLETFYNAFFHESCNDTSLKKIFNIRCSRACHDVENFFSYLGKKWTVFFRLIKLHDRLCSNCIYKCSFNWANTASQCVLCND